MLLCFLPNFSATRGHQASLYRIEPCIAAFQLDLLSHRRPAPQLLHATRAHQALTTLSPFASTHLALNLLHLPACRPAPQLLQS